MKILLTFDYELFFGSHSGSAEKCLLRPTERLLNLAKKYNASFTFFIDCGYLLKAEEFALDFPEIQSDLENVKIQINQMVSEGHAIGLHIHPHWEKSFYSEGKWHMFTDGAYKLSDFDDAEIMEIVTRYKSYLDQLTGQTTKIYRAGGWCIQPFNRLSPTFKALGLKLDSSVMPGARYIAGEYSYDFSMAPNKSSYRFEEDVCEENNDGFFIEYPIATMRYSPLFYWKLYVLGRLFPKQHKMVGDGLFLAQPGRKRTNLTKATINHVSADGYYSSQLIKSLRTYEKKGDSTFVVIGHPKSMTEYSFKKLDQFLATMNTKHLFDSLTEVL